MKKLTNTLLAFASILLGSQNLHAGKGNGPDKGTNLGAQFYNGEVVGTVAPGDQNYRVGKWKVSGATWIGEGPTPLFTSAGAVDNAYDAGNLEIVLVPTAPRKARPQVSTT